MRWRKTAFFSWFYGAKLKTRELVVSEYHGWILGSMWSPTSRVNDEIIQLWNFLFAKLISFKPIPTEKTISVGPYLISKVARHNFRRHQTITKRYADLWLSDLLEPYTQENNGFRYALVVIICYLKYLYIKALEKKTAREVTKAFWNFLGISGYSAKNLQTDSGAEFHNHQSRELMKNHNINNYSTTMIL